MGERQKRHVLRVRPSFGSGRRVWKAQALLDQKLQPAGREPIAAGVSTPDDLSVLAHHPPTGDHLYLPVEHSIHRQLCRSATRDDTRRHNHIRVEHHQSHFVLRRCRTTQTRSISRLISSSVKAAPAASATRQFMRRLAFAMARRSSRSSRMTSPHHGDQKVCRPLLTRQQYCLSIRHCFERLGTSGPKLA